MGNYEERQQLRYRIDDYKEKLGDVFNAIKKITDHLNNVYSALYYMYQELERVKYLGYNGPQYHDLVGIWKRDIDNTKGEVAYNKDKRTNLYEKVKRKLTNYMRGLEIYNNMLYNPCMKIPCL